MFVEQMLTTCTIDHAFAVDIMTSKALKKRGRDQGDPRRHPEAIRRAEARA